MQIPFATNSYKSRSLPVSAQRCINMYAEMQPQDAKSNVVLFGAPGLISFSSASVGPIRGLWNMNGILYAVSGNGLYSISSTGVAVLLGTGISGTGVVSMSDNGTQLLIVNGTNGYVYSIAGGFVLITSTNFFPSNTVTFFDNYFVFDRVGTNRYFISASLDGTTYSALDFASAAVNPDFVLGTINQQENLLIFGEETIETWYDSGDVNFPFNRYDGATIERGCGAAKTILKEDNSVFFLGNDGIFYRLNGVIPVRISTHAIEYEWSKYTTLSNANAYSYTWNGHKFVVVQFPSGPATWVYDIATNLWHERVSFDVNANSLGRWRGNVSANCYGKVLVGDAFNGTIGYLSDTTYAEYGNTIQAYLVSPVIHSDRKRVFMNRFELDMETGVGLNTGQGSDPQVMLDWSDDGGRTFKPLQIWNSFGKIGEFTKRLRWLRLGQARNRVMRITISDPVTRTIIANNVDLRVATM